MSKRQGIEHELHGAGVHDHVVHLDPALVLLGDMLAGLEEQAGERLEDVGLVDHGDFLAAMPDRVLEREAGNALAAFARIHAGADGRRVRIVALRDVELVRDIEAAQVFPDQHQVDILVAAGHDGVDRADVAEQLEFLAQAHIG